MGQFTERLKGKTLNIPERKKEEGAVHVAVGVPSTGTWEAEFGISMSLMLSFASHVRFPGAKRQSASIIHTQGSMLCRNRQLIVQQAQLKKMDWLLWVDSDMKFPKETLHHLLGQALEHDLKCVGANCVTKVIPSEPTARYEGDGPKGKKVYTEPGSEGLEEVWRLGFGCMLTHMDLYREMEEPWFDMPYSEEVGAYYGEDWYFCKKVKEMGYGVWVDHDLSKVIKHIGGFEYGHEFVAEVVQDEDGNKVIEEVA